MKHPIVQSRNGAQVYVDLIQSQAAKHISQHPHLLGLLAEALQQITLRGADAILEHDMGHVIGYSFVIKTAGSNNDDGVFYAQLLRDNTYTRFVKKGKPVATRYLSMVLRRDEDGAYELTDVHIGRQSPPRPGTADETAESKSYWDTHAAILGSETLQLRSITKVRPY